MENSSSTISSGGIKEARAEDTSAPVSRKPSHLIFPPKNEMGTFLCSVAQFLCSLGITSRGTTWIPGKGVDNQPPGSVFWVGVNPSATALDLLDAPLTVSALI